MLPLLSNIRVVVLLASSILLPTINKKDGVICKTESCISTAYRIKSYMDESVSPCENFYKFACGNFLKQTKIGESESEHSIINDLAGKVSHQMKALIQNKIQFSEVKPQIILKTFYRLCINEGKMNSRGVAPALALLEKVGGWPLISKWDAQNWDIFEVALKLRELGIENNGFFKLSVASSPKGKRLQVEQPDLIVPRAMLLQGANHPDVKAYLDFMVDIAVMFGAKRQIARDQMSRVLLFQLRLAEITIPPEFKQYPVESKLEDLKKTQPWMKWEELSNGVHPSTVSDWDNEIVIVGDPTYFANIERLFNNLPTDVSANYMMWHAAFSLTELLTNAMRNRKHAFTRKLFGVKKMPRWRQCVRIANADLNIALASLYIHTYLDADTKNEAISLATNIRKETRNMLMELDWMDPQTKEQADLKTTEIDLEMGYTGELNNVHKLQKYYEQLKVNGKHFLESFLDVNKWKMNRVLYEDRADFHRGYNPIQLNNFGNLNGHLDIVANSLRFPASMLQSPFFNPKLPNYLNYGAFGNIVGREITHAIDHDGSLFNAEGEYKPWWVGPTWHMFNEKTDCFVNQYSSFAETNTNINVNGMRTLGNNIADNGGLKLAFRAYQHKMVGRDEMGLPGLQKYSSPQLMLINYANMMCTAYKPEALQRLMAVSNVPPAEFRVNVPIMNLPEFEKVFTECKVGTPMNPEKKCSVW